MNDGPFSPQGSPWQPRPHIVQRVRRESSDTVTLYVAPLDPLDEGVGQPSPEPGQFNMLYLFGRGEAPISVSGISRRSGNIHHTVKAAGPLTRALTELQSGDKVGLRGPFGNSWPLDGSRGRNLLLIAGGIGMAPIRAAMRVIMRHPERYERVDLIYGSRTPQDILYVRQLERWSRHEQIFVHLTVDHGDAGWQGAVGFVTEQLNHLDVQPDRTTAFLCGPEIMMRHTMTKLIDLKISPADIHLSMERNMRCAIGVCGHCQWGADFICRQGPVFAADKIREKLRIRAL